MSPNLPSIVILKTSSHSKETLLLDLQQVTSHLATNQMPGQNAAVEIYPLENPLLACLHSNQVVANGPCSLLG